jgi:hypothetical protein
VNSKQSYDLLTDQVETASVEGLLAAGHLQNTVSLGRKRWGEQQTFHLVHFV